MLIVQRRQVLSVFQHQRALMAPLLAGVDIFVVLVLHLLLLQLSLVLLHLLGTTSIVSHIIQVHLLLDVNVVF